MHFLKELLVLALEREGFKNKIKDFLNMKIRYLI